MAINYLSQLEGFDWDKGNSYKSILKHKVSAQESEEVFANKPLIILPDETHGQPVETRFHAFGKTLEGRLLLVSFTIRTKKIRVISARPMNAKEREFYATFK